MPKSTLGIADLDKLEYVIYLKNDLGVWRSGLEGTTLSTTDRDTFHALGTQVMGDEGFNDFYQGLKLTNSIQRNIDSQTRLYTLLFDNEAQVSFKPLPKTKTKQVEWNKITEIMTYKLGEVWTTFNDDQSTDNLTTAERAALDVALAELYGSAKLLEAVQSGTETSV